MLIGILTVMVIATPFTIYANIYEVVAYKNCNPIYNNQPLKIGMSISDPKLLEANWNNQSGSKYIKLANLQTNQYHIITPPSKLTNPKSEENFFSWLWGFFSGQKKCSTRASENELAGGLAENLSQTFYLLISDTPSKEPALEFASNLAVGSILHCTYYLYGKKYSFDVPLMDNEFKFSYDSFPTISADFDRLILRLNVEYVAPDGQTVPLTDSMNVILIHE